MKKLFKTALLLILCLSVLACFTACGNKAENVSQMIDAIGAVTLQSADAITAAETAYMELEESDKQKVENYQALVDARNTYEYIRKPEIVKDLMAQLEEIDENSGETIQALELAYETLDDKQKDEFADFKDFVLTAQLQFEKATLYSKAMAAKNAGNYDEAEKYFRTLFPRGSYKDATEQFEEMQAKQLLQAEKEEAEIALSYLSSDTSMLLSEDKKRLSLPETAPNGVSYAEMAKVYCGDPNLSYILNPKTYEDHLDNIKYVLLTGKWEYSDYDVRDLKEQSEYWVFVGDGYEGQFLEFPKDPALLGNFGNGGNDMGVYYYQGIYYYAKNGLSQDYFYSPEELQKQIYDSYSFVKAKYDEFRKNGRITEKSSEYEIAKLYSDWFNSININMPKWLEDDPSWEDRAADVKYCPAYASLINHNGICLSRCAAFCLMMRMEGITVHGLVCGGKANQNRSIGHIVPWMLLDGKEYVYEHNMSLGLLEVDKNQECSVLNGRKYHQFQEYFYSRILKEEGIEYDNSLDGKVYWDDNGNPLSWTEWYAYLKNQQ